VLLIVMRSRRGRGGGPKPPQGPGQSGPYGGNYSGYNQTPYQQQHPYGQQQPPPPPAPQRPHHPNG
jgi:hypothetical protein